MFERPPKESELLSWGYVFVWCGVIFATVPFVREAVDYVQGQWGDDTFTYGVTAVVILVLAASLVLLLKQRRKLIGSYAWLLGLAGIVVYLTLDSETPVEAVHFVQYGLLSLLLYRAFSHRIRDTSIYVAATIAGTLAGMIDETVQWLTPGRIFQLKDIGLNFTGVALVQLALAAGIRPKIISGWPDGTSLQRLCRLGAVAITYLGLCHLNTPDRIAWYKTHIPFLGFIDENRSVMAEYGYFHSVTANARFRSRLTTEELRRLARSRAEEGARILDRYREREEYPEFLNTYTPVTDPFLHEARVHLFRRDVHLERTRNKEQIDKRTGQFTVAYWENRILEEYFGDLLHASSYSWPAELEAQIKENVPIDRPYVSWASHYLITSLSERQVFWLTLSSVAGLLLLGAFFGRRRPH